jgi:hypothetical protein
MQSIAEIIWGLHPDFIQQNDSYQENDPQGRGIYQRFLEGVLATEFDEHLLPKIDNLIAYTRSSDSILDTIVPIREASLGLPAPLYVDINLRKKLLPYLPLCMRKRGTLDNYKFLLGLLGFNVSIDENIDTGGWDSGTWDSGRWDSFANINGTFQLLLAKRYPFTITPELEAQIHHIVEWNCPIYCECSYLIVDVLPIIDVYPDALDFGSVIAGEELTLPFTIENLGGSDLIISNIIPPFPLAYSADWSSGVIPSSGTQIVNLTFSPTSVGGFSGELTVVSDAFMGDNEIDLTATAIAATRIIGVTPTSLAFGEVEVGDTATQNFTITNTGNSPLVVTSLTFPFPTYTSSWSSGTIAPAGSQVVTITFAPTASGVQNGNIVVNSNATGGANTVAVTANGATETFRGIRYDGLSNKQIQFLHNATWDFTDATEWTWSAWITTPAVLPTNYTNIIIKASSLEGWAVAYKNNQIRFYRGNFYTFYNYSFSPSTTYNITITLTSSREKLFINGVLVIDNPRVSATTSTSSTQPMNLGINTFTVSDFAGTIFDMKILNTAVTNTQAINFYSSIIDPVLLPSITFHAKLNSIYTLLSLVYTKDEITDADGRLINWSSGQVCVVDSAENPITNYP